MMVDYDIKQKTTAVYILPQYAARCTLDTTKWLLVAGDTIDLIDVISNVIPHVTNKIQRCQGEIYD